VASLSSTLFYILNVNPFNPFLCTGYADIVLTKKEALELKIKLNVTSKGREMKEIGDILYNFASGQAASIYTANDTIYTANDTIYTANDTIYTANDTIYTANDTIYTDNNIIYTTNDTIYIANDTINTVNDIIYTANDYVFNFLSKLMKRNSWKDCIDL
jgi:hypothetical protein